MVSKQGTLQAFNALLLQESQKGNTTAKKICAVYGESTVTKRTVWEWFLGFKADYFNTEDQERTSRYSTTD